MPTPLIRNVPRGSLIYSTLRHGLLKGLRQTLPLGALLLAGCIDTGLKDVASKMDSLGAKADLLGFEKILNEVRADTRRICDLEHSGEISRLNAEIQSLRTGAPLPNLATVTRAPLEETAFRGDQTGDVKCFTVPQGARLATIRVCSGRWVTGVKFTYSNGTWDAWGYETDDRVESFSLGEREYVANVAFREGRVVDWLEFTIHGGERPHTEHLGRPGGESGHRTLNLDVRQGFKVVGLNMRQRKGGHPEIEGLSALIQPLP